MNIYRNISNIESLEREYSPSSCIDDIREFTDAYAARSNTVRKSSPNHRVIQYGQSTSESLDFFPVATSSSGTQRRPLLAYIHGGYWQQLSKDDHSFLAPALHKHGYHYIAIGYRVAPEAGLEEIVGQILRALAWIANNCSALAVDSGAIHVAGSSAGAQLAAMAGLADWPRLGRQASPICSFTLLSGVFDLRPLVLTYVNNALQMTEMEALRNSPLLSIDAFQRSLPPTLIAYGDNETSEFKRQSGDFFATLTRRGYLATIQEIPGRNHFDLPFDLAEESTTLGTMTLQHLDDSARAARRCAEDDRDTTP